MASLSTIYKQRTFTLQDVMENKGMTRSAAAGALVRWQEQGLVKLVRRNFYVVMDPATDTPIADKYELASQISSDSFVGWHTALEFLGVAHQPFYNVFVGDKSRFHNFRFEGVNYEYCASRFEVSEENGIISPIGNPYVRVTSMERTIVDCCDRIDRAGGLEELMHCLEAVSFINEEKLIKYLAMYDKVFLYQKVGFILEYFQERNNISEDFIDKCRRKGAIHTKRLTNADDSDQYVSRWKLYVPQICITENSNYELI